MSRIETYQRKQKQTQTPLLPIVLGLFFALSLIGTSIYFLVYPFPSTEKVDYFSSQYPIIFDNKVYDQSAIVEEGTIYFPYEFVKNEIDPTIFFDEKGQSVILTTKNRVLQMPSEKLEMFVNEELFTLEFPIVKEHNTKRYIALELLLDYYPIKFNVIDETGAVFVQKDGDVRLPATVNLIDNPDELRLRLKPDQTTPYTAELLSNESVSVLEDVDGYYLVRKRNGIAGYVKKHVLTLSEPTIVSIEIKREFPVIKQISWPINLTWEAVYTKNPDPKNLPELPGVNVVSPTWFHLKNEDGDIENLGSQEYMDWAKQKGFQVWALFSNNFDPELTHKALNNFETRQKIIRQLLEYSQVYQLDGINIDIENVNYEDRHIITQFVRELTPYLHQAGLIVSMDVTFISGSPNWSMFYERDKLSEVVDYMMVMAYDEHWASSPKAGSVSSFPWVEGNLEEILKVVPNDKLILGIPLYTRIWKEKKTDDGGIEVSSKAHSMDYVTKWLDQHNLTPVYNEESGQYIAEYYNKEEDATYKVWIEDETSLKKRAQLVHQYRLAGVATWSRYFANDQAWTAIMESLNEIRPVIKQEEADSPE